MTDEAGQTVWASEYTPFGGKHSVAGELEKAAKFTGKDLDEDIGLYYFNARWYDQETGRFVSEDPGKDSNNPNLYVYGSNNPLTHIDPTGMFWEEFKNFFTTNYGWRNDAQVKEYKDQIAQAEKDIPGFKYDHNDNLRLESQIQLYQATTVLEKKLNDGEISNFEFNEATRQLKNALVFLNAKTDLYNLTNKDKKGYSYSWTQINDTAENLGFTEMLAAIGLGVALSNSTVINTDAISEESITVRHATTSSGTAQNVLNGIDPKRFGATNRFGPAFYVTQNGETAVSEVTNRNVTATTVIRYNMNLSGQKVLDLTNPSVAKTWGFETGLSTPQTCQAIAQKATVSGYNVIAFPSYRGAGTNFAIYNNFDDILSPVMVSPVKAVMP